jgi:hypothetical protein
VEIDFIAPQDLGGGASICMVPASVPHGSEKTNEEKALVWELLAGRKSGRVVLITPGEENPQHPGMYQIRINDGHGREVAYSNPTYLLDLMYPFKDQGGVALYKDTYAPGEAMTVQFISSRHITAKAFVAMVPSSTPHKDQAANSAQAVSLQLLNARLSGELYFSAPAAPGEYDCRMYDGQGLELWSVTYTVK